ncbi:MAG TPA: hypothetical protein ENH55_05705 [Aurantimonas coralicida]|uniref:Uncharacterized protein n=2 Tax=root TaxID=1 RepID=A0A9C9NG71_9HYPH|nr:hypothetical protein [Aurantimonas coralicida]HEU01268.1 hypothetical protein [Aurantimonas coralicida]
MTQTTTTSETTAAAMDRILQSDLIPIMETTMPQTYIALVKTLGCETEADALAVPYMGDGHDEAGVGDVFVDADFALWTVGPALGADFERGCSDHWIISAGGKAFAEVRVDDDGTVAVHDLFTTAEQRIAFWATMHKSEVMGDVLDLADSKDDRYRLEEIVFLCDYDIIRAVQMDAQVDIHPVAAGLAIECLRNYIAAAGMIRAGIWTSSDKSSSLLLTSEDDAGLERATLLARARNAYDGDPDDGEIEVGVWHTGT